MLLETFVSQFPSVFRPGQSNSHHWPTRQGSLKLLVDLFLKISHSMRYCCNSSWFANADRARRVFQSQLFAAPGPIHFAFASQAFQFVSICAHILWRPLYQSES